MYNVEALSDKELSILGLLSQGYSTLVISERLGLDRPSLRSTIVKMYVKLGINTLIKYNPRTRAAFCYLEHMKSIEDSKVNV